MLKTFSVIKESKKGVNLFFSEKDHVYVMQLNDRDNAFTPHLIRCIHEALDVVERASAPCVLVTVGTGKFFSNGIDLGWLAEAVQKDSASAKDFSIEFSRLLARILTFCVPTIAAINGHAVQKPCPLPFSECANVAL